MVAGGAGASFHRERRALASGGVLDLQLGPVDVGPEDPFP